MKLDIADPHKNIFIYWSFLKNRHVESHIASRDVSKFKCFCYVYFFNYVKYALRYLQTTL